MTRYSSRKHPGTADPRAVAPRAFLGAFGKHPAWPDHILPGLDLGGDLPAVMDVLYFAGIQESVPYWRQADVAAHLVPFEHLVAWRVAPHDWVVLRLWQSADGASPPRRDYPMVACAQVAGRSADWVLREVPAVLADVEAACKAAKTRDAVRDAVTAGRDELLRRIAADPDDAAPAGPSAEAQLRACAPVGPLGLGRAGYVLGAPPVGPGREPSPGPGRDSDDSPERSRAARVPRCEVAAADALGLWARFLAGRFDDGAVVLVSLPVEGDWADLVVGAPSARDFRNLRIDRSLVAPDTEVAYDLTGTPHEPSADPALAGPSDEFAFDSASGSADAPPQTGWQRYRTAIIVAVMAVLSVVIFWALH